MFPSTLKRGCHATALGCASRRNASAAFSSLFQPPVASMAFAPEKTASKCFGSKHRVGILIMEASLTPAARSFEIAVGVNSASILSLAGVGNDDHIAARIVLRALPSVGFTVSTVLAAVEGPSPNIEMSRSELKLADKALARCRTCEQVSDISHRDEASCNVSYERGTDALSQKPKTPVFSPQNAPREKTDT